MPFRDEIYMARALGLAENGLYTTDPNPRVACVLVKDDKIISEAWHVKTGSAHAEVIALKKVSSATETTAYVTLEPCSHSGHTGPCCEAIITAGVQRVVVAMKDPNPLVAGRGIKRMLDAGIKVDCGILQKDAEALNRGFIKRMATGLPFIRSKLAMSMDGRTAMASGASKWITSPQSRADVQRLRAESSAILTGINTVLADDPSLDVRLDGDVTQPVRIILDSKLQISPAAKMFSLSGQTWILTCSENEQKIKQLNENERIQVFRLKNKGDRLDLEAVMLFMGQKQINTVLVEAGAILNGALLDGNWVDEWVVYMATCILGDQGRGLFHLPSLQKIANKKQFYLSSIRQIGPDLKLTLKGEKESQVKGSR